MSNFTDFFPLAASGGGGGDITDPDKINKITLGTGITSYMKTIFYNMQQNGSARLADSTFNGLLGSYVAFNFTGGGPVEATDDEEITLANVSGSGGYLCNIITPLGAKGTTQTIKITVDGGTEKVYAIDYDKGGAATSFDDVYTRLLWGTCAWGSQSDKNLPDNTDAVGLGGLGGMPYTYNDFTFPPINEAPGALYANARIFSPSVFKNYNLPRLRFNSSLVVKCTTLALYEESTYNAKGAATYYLDSQL